MIDPRFFTRLYRNLLLFYPSRFREEFSDEMETVFGEAISEAASQGGLALGQTLLRELTSLPGEALRQSWNSYKQQSIPVRWDGPPSWREALVALAVFMLPVAQIVVNAHKESSSGMLWASAGVLLIGALLAGVAKGFPRWSLPYLGLALSAVSFFLIFQRAADLTAPVFLARMGVDLDNESAALLFQVCWAGLMWLSLFVCTFLVLGLLAVLHKFRPLLDRIRQDWTLASYILYSGTLFTLLLAFDQYRYEASSTITISLCLGTGAWFYLRSPYPWQRTLALLAGLTLAMWTAITGQWPAFFQDGQGWLQWQVYASEGWFEARRAVFLWGWMVVVILAPALLRWIPAYGKRASLA